MNIIAHIETLSEKHSELEEKIKYAQRHHLSVIELKKQKLRIKDEIARLSRLAMNKNSKIQVA